MNLILFLIQGKKVKDFFEHIVVCLADREKTNAETH